MTSDVKPGTVWQGSDHTRFVVIDVVDIEGNTWVHYRQDLGMHVAVKECKEYSCYLESFEQRFRKTVA